MAHEGSRTLAVLQARTSSRRLPGKVLKPILGRAMILRQIERIQRARSLFGLVLATSTDSSDDALAETCSEAGVAVHRGALDDVLDRCFRAAETEQPNLVARLTGDCPLADWQVIDQVVEACIAQGADYASNTLTPTWPDGLDVEVMRYSALESARQAARDAFEREHVTPYIHNHPELFSLASVERDGADLSALRWTVDEPEDFAFVEQIYGALHVAKPAFTTDDVLDLLKRRPELGEINARFHRNAGAVQASGTK